MSKEFLCRSTCDRCKKVISEDVDADPPGELSDQHPELYIEFAGQDGLKTITFKDMCSSCMARVHVLIEQMQRRGAEKKMEEEAKKGAAKNTAAK